ncbi:MAG: hypothetical protein IKG03_00430 [Clostridiales bacterium]|nr:hypothetical protein [Clostridiales bacterium]
MEEMRVCRRCGRLLPESEYYQRKSRPRDKIYECKKCVCEMHNEYAKKNPERVKEIAARGRAKHREEIRQRNKEFYARTKDDPAHIAARKASYERGKDKWRENDRRRRAEFNQRWKHPCEKCGESRLYLIQFHHIDPATKSFCIGAQATAKKEELLTAEVKKCVCLCSNCHDEFHYFYGNKPEKPVESLEEYLGRKII